MFRGVLAISIGVLIAAIVSACGSSTNRSAPRHVTTTIVVATPAPPAPTPPPPPAPKPNVTPPAPPVAVTSAGSSSQAKRVCWPAVKIPPTRLPATHIPATTIPPTTIPATTIPATTLNGVHYPAQHYPAQHYPAQHYPAVDYPAQTIPGTTIPRTCFDSRSYLAPSHTTVRVRDYQALDPGFSRTLSDDYWRGAGSVPDYTAPGFGELNAAGFPKNQYVRSYVRRDGTFVHGYWRNSPSDGLPTCQIISC
jgi:hypothetical protein